MKLKKLLEDIKIRLTESVFDISEDVDYIFEAGGYKDFLQRFENGERPYSDKILKEQDIAFGYVSSKDLKSSDALRASLVEPVMIYCGIFSSGNHYTPNTNTIQTSLNSSAVYVIYSGEVGNLNSSLKKRVSNEITDFKIKSSISHEVSHWISNVIHNRHLSKILNTAFELKNQELVKLGQKDVNMTYFEIDAQIHGILEIYRKFKEEWDIWTLEDVFNHYIPLGTINTLLSRKYGVDIANIWQKNLIKRMSREGILGKNMKNFVKD